MRPANETQLPLELADTHATGPASPFATTHEAGPEKAGGRVAAADAPSFRLQIGRYKIVRELGRGGMGIVYLARDPDLGREVALKVLPPGVARAEDVERFRREATAAARLSHPNVIALHDVGSFDGLHYFTMECVAGGTLAARLKAAGRLPVMEAVRVVREAALGVAHAHTHGIVHRDLKPENLLLDGDPPRVRVSDFGLARAIREEEGSPRLTRTEAILGTPTHMAPEQAAGRQDRVDARTDVYALGSILYEAATGRTPYMAGGAIEMIVRKLAREPDPPRRALPSLAPDVATIIQKAIERDPARRYATAQELADDLGRFLAGEAVRAQPPSRTYRLRRWVGRNRPLAVVGAGLMVAILAAAAQVLGPAVLSVESDPPGARVLVDGASTRRTTPTGRMWVWPPRQVSVGLELEGRLPVRQEVTAGAMRRARVRAALPAADGFLSVEVAPATAEMVLKQGGAEVRRLRGPQEHTSLPVGTYLAEVVAPEHQPITTAFDIRSDAETRLLPIRLEHDKVNVTLTAVPEGVTASLYPLPPGTPADGRPRPVRECDLPKDPPLLQLPTPIQGYGVDTGAYRVIWQKKGYFPRETRVDLRPAGRTIALNAGLPDQFLWTHRIGGLAASSPVIGDLDGDGHLDVTLCNSNGVYALSGVDGAVLWTFERAFNVFWAPAVGDLDGDGQLDVVILANRTVFALSGRDGAVLWTADIALQPDSSTIVVDLDGDGRLEVIVASSDHKVHALAGRNGAVLWSYDTGDEIRFMTAVAVHSPCWDVLVGSMNRVEAICGEDLGASGKPWSHLEWRHDWDDEWNDRGNNSLVAGGDLDADGLPDCIVLRGQTVHALGVGGKKLWTWNAKDSGVYEASACDVDGDGHVDVIVQAEGVSVLSGRDGTLLWQNLECGSGPPPALGDVDGDGQVDVVAGGGGGVSAFSGKDGATLWTDRGDGGVQCSPVIADLDGDGDLDIVVVSTSGTACVLKGHDDALLWASSAHGLSSAVTDLDGDGRADIVAQFGTSAINALSGRDGAPLWTKDVPSYCEPLVGDVDGDGLPDVVSHNGSGIFALSGRDGGQLWSRKTNQLPGQPAMADLDGDGRPDMIVGSRDGMVRALSGRSGVELWASKAINRAYYLAAPAVGDVDGDGLLDVVSGSADQKVYALSGRNGAPLWTYEMGAWVLPLAVADLDGDGSSDVIVGDNKSRLHAISGRTGTALWTFDHVLAKFAPAVADLDGDGHLDVVVPAGFLVYAISGVNGKILWTYRANGSCGEALPVADLDGDVLPDIVIAGSAGLYALSGRDGAVLWFYGTGKADPTNLYIADLDGDHKPDVIANIRGVICGFRIGTALLAPSTGPRTSPARGSPIRPEDVARVANALKHWSVQAAFRATTLLMAVAEPRDPYYLPLLRLSAIAELAIGRNMEAMAHLDAWRDRAGEPGPEAGLLRAIVQGRLGDATRAAADLRRALGVQPNEVDGWLKRDWRFVTAEDREHLAAAARAVAEAPDAASLSARSLGMAWFLAGDGAHADAEITRALAAPDTPLVWYFYRARARLIAKDLDGALADAERARDLRGLGSSVENLVDEIREAQKKR
ncbi:MAG: VCBS repeat-containing protein [Planctomycetes bacterium]|nr:VCBS repeat-containing protein [Planctomycetota bacterium]